MQIVDLTHPMLEGMPVFPGDPVPHIAPACTLTQDGIRLSALSMGSHTGTHMDAPAHVLPQGETLDAAAPGRFLGRGVVLDCRHYSSLIPATVLDALEGALEADYLLLHTGWSRMWGKPGYFTSYPVPDAALAERLAVGGWKGIGIDAPNVDPAENTPLANHRVLLHSGKLIVENLCRLEQLPPKPFWFCALPLLWKGSDGAPVRALAIWEDEDG